MVPAIDASEFPIVKFVFGEEVSLDEIDLYYQRTLDLFHSRGPFVAIANIGEIRFASMTAAHRIKMARLADDLTRRGAFLAEFVVVESSLLRALFIFYVYQRKSRGHPLRCFESTQKARKAGYQLLLERAQQTQRHPS